MISSRLLVAFACVFVVALTVEDWEIENYIKDTFSSYNVSDNAVAGYVRNIGFFSDDRLFFYTNGTELLASLDGSEFINVNSIFPNATIEAEKKADTFYGSVDGRVFILFENATVYKLTELNDQHEFEVIRKPSEEFEVSGEENGTHVDEAKVFIRRVNDVYSKLLF